MKLATVSRAEGQTRAGRVEGNEIVLLPFADVGELLASGENWPDSATSNGERIALADARLLRPVANPSKIFCVGRNYLEHIREGGNDQGEAPAFPELFVKFADSLTGPYQDIPLPAGSGYGDVREAVSAAAKVPTLFVPVTSDCVDWEAELVVVVGKTVRRAGETEAAAAIAGFTVGNDVSVRDWQLATPTMTMGKSFDTHGPMGPWMVTADEIGDPHRLRLQTWVNDDLRQDAKTDDLIFDCFQQVEHLTTAFTLEPGDVVATGTPAGVGIAMKPPAWLVAGDVVRIEIEGIGTLENPVAAEPV
jgi:2-keto-4-pentenoate hydratase/2-oxohepta-3-ene-1,7-dioic acid hydratase in catechol pathway